MGFVGKKGSKAAVVHKTFEKNGLNNFKTFWN